MIRMRWTKRGMASWGGMIVVALLLSACGATAGADSPDEHPSVESDKTVQVTSGVLTPTLSSDATVGAEPTVVMPSTQKGAFHTTLTVGAKITSGQVLGDVDGTPVVSSVDGTVAAVLESGAYIPQGYPLVSVVYHGFAMTMDVAGLLRMGVSDGLRGRFQIVGGQGPTDCVAVLPAESVSGTDSAGNDSESSDSGSANSISAYRSDTNVSTPRARMISAYAPGAQADSDDSTASGSTSDSQDGSSAAGDADTKAETSGHDTGAGSLSYSTQRSCLISKDIAVAAGESGTLVLTGSASAQSLLLPVSAVAGRSGNGTVTRIVDGERQTVQVGLGASDGARIVITSGLSEGDTVLAISPDLTTIVEP